MKLELLVPEAK